MRCSERGHRVAVAIVASVRRVAELGSLGRYAHIERFVMTKRTFMITSAAAGLAAFLIFRWFTHPLEVALIWLLLLAFVSSSLICAAGFSVFCQHIRWRWIRLLSVPFFLAAFILCSGLGVFGVTRLVWDSRPRSADSGGILYAATSGMQMHSLDHDTWYHVVFAVALPLLLLSAVSVIAAFTGIHGTQIRKHAV